jgi:hypothetical protein
MTVPPGHGTVVLWAAFNRSSGSDASRVGATAVTPAGSARLAMTGSDTLPPLLLTVIGKSDGSAPGMSVNGEVIGVLRFGGAGWPGIGAGIGAGVVGTGVGDGDGSGTGGVGVGWLGVG